MRLWDHLIAEGAWVSDRAGYAALPNRPSHKHYNLAPEDRGAVVVVADNVAEYLYAETDQEYWELGTDFPNIAPPWQRFFVEWRAPSKVLSEDYGEQPWEGDQLTGTYFLANKVEDVPQLRDEWREGGGWVITAIPFTRNNRRNYQAASTITFRVDADGTVPPSPKDPERAFMLTSGGGIEQLPAEAQLQLTNSLQSMALWIPFLTVSFLHCKNVTVQGVEPPAKLLKKHRKRGRELHSYHVLEIEPMTRQIRNTQEEHGVGTAKALHIRRGEFRDYTEKGLFGKHRGVYWFDSHVRGSKERGIADKSYDVKVPEGGHRAG